MRFTSSPRGRGEVELAVVGADLLRVRHAGLLRAERRLGEHVVEQLDGELGRPREDAPASSSASIGNARCAAIGPASSSFTVSWIVTPVSRVAGHDRALDRRRSAPARQQRRMDVEPEPARRAGLRDQQPVGADDDDRRPEARARPSGRSGWSTGMPSRSAASFAGGGVERPAPARAAGRAGSAAPTTSCRAASRSSTSAPNGAVAATAIRTGCGYSRAERRLRPELRERLAPRLGVGAVEDQDAVEVVELVLDDARRQALELEPERLAASRSWPSTVTARRRSTGTRTPEREAALVVDLGLVGPRSTSRG